MVTTKTWLCRGGGGWWGRVQWCGGCRGWWGCEGDGVAAVVKVGVSAGGDDGGGCRRRVVGIWPERRQKMGGEEEGVCVVARVIMNETLAA
ncbi:hypothetical protein Tco_1246228 [Tanacetum coccineum]